MKQIKRRYPMDYDTMLEVLDALYDEIFIYDGNYRVVYVNQACARHYGCSPEEMIGKVFFDFAKKDWWTPSVLPIIYEEKKPYAINQSTYLGEKLLTIAVPMFDPDGKIKFVAMSVRDSVREIDLYDPNTHGKADAASADADAEARPIGDSEDMRNVLALIEKMADIDVTCILSGETGTGKTMLAKRMHLLSRP